MAHGASHAAQVGFMRVAFGEILGLALDRQRCVRAVTPEAPVVLYCAVGQGRLFSMTAAAAHHGFGMQVIHVAGVEPGGKHLFHDGQVRVLGGSPREVLIDEPKPFSRLIAVAYDAPQMDLRIGVRQVHASGKCVLLRVSRLSKRVAAYAAGKTWLLNFKVSPGQHGGKIGMAGRAGIRQALRFQWFCPGGRDCRDKQHQQRENY